jgi:hypothetical protein
MSDLSDLHGILPTALRWNAEDGILGISTFNPETGERELQPIEFGQPATFVMDLATRERGYGKIMVGLYDMRLTPVGSPPPPWPGDAEGFKPALGCWLWNPQFGEVKIETCGTMFRNSIENVWRLTRFEPQAMEGQQPVIRFVDKVEVNLKALRKSFFTPIIKNVGWAERDKVPGWRERAPTVAPPSAAPTLGPQEPAKTPIESHRHHKAVRPETADPVEVPIDPADETPRS